MNIFTQNKINWNLPGNQSNIQNPHIAATMTESFFIRPNNPNKEEENHMQSEEAICVSALKNKRMVEQQKSKRKAFINNLRKKMYEEDSNLYQNQHDQQIHSQMVQSQNSQQVGEQLLYSLDEVSNIANSGCSASNPEDPINSPQNDFNFMMNNNGMANDSLVNNNSNRNSQQTGEGIVIHVAKIKCSPADIIQLIQYVYKSGQKLPYKESRQLKQELNLLRKNLVQINNNMNSSGYSSNGMSQQANMNIMEGGEEINFMQQHQQMEINRKKTREAELFGNEIEKMIQVFQGMIYIISNQEKFSMDVVYECIWTLSNYSSTEEMRREILQIYESNGETFLNFINHCVRMVDQHQSSILITKVVLILGNICLESVTFCQSIIVHQSNQLLSNIQNTILYLPNAQLIAETVWLLNIFYKTTKFYYQNDLIVKNITHILNKFKTQPRVVQEVLWYLIALSQDEDNQFHLLYFDDNVLIKILTVLFVSSHNGNTIACFTLLSNALAMLPQERVEFLVNLVTLGDLQINNQLNIDIVITKPTEFNPNYKNALILALNKCISSNIIQVQRECFVFLSNLVVLFPLFIAQQPELINSLLQIFQNGQEELFVDLCFIFSNLFIQLPQSPLLVQQHPHIVPLLQAILSNDNIQQKYSASLSFIFQHFSNYLQSIKF